MANTEMAQRKTAGRPDDLVLMIEKDFSAPPSLVFLAWTDPAHLARWFGPRGFTVPEARMDLRPGGKWYSCMKSPEGNLHKVQGVYKEIRAPHKLSFTWAWLDEKNQPKHETLVTVTFDPKGQGTHLTLEQRVFESPGATASHNEGWSSSFDCLADYLATMKG